MTVPWLNTINEAPWNSSQPIFNRIVSIHRLKTIAGTSDVIGGTGYSGAEQGVGAEGESVLFTNLPAAVQASATGRTTQSGMLPADAVSKPIWIIFIPSAVITQYSVRDRDIIIDDELYRYEVSTNYWTPFGYRLSSIRQES